MKTLLALLLCLTGPLAAAPSLLLSPQPGWNGWSVEAKVKAGFREHGGPGEVAGTDTRVQTIALFGTLPGDVITLPVASVSRTPLSGAAKDKAEGSLAFRYQVGTAATQDAFSFTIDSTTSAMTAKQDFGAGPVPADAFFECELKLRTFSPLGAGNFITIPQMPALTSPATETMSAVIDSPIAGFRLPGMPPIDMPLTLEPGQHFIYTLTYSIVTPYGEDPHITYTLSGGAGGQTMVNVVPNPEFEITSPAGNPITTTAAAPAGPSAAEFWQQSLVNGTQMTTTLVPSTNSLGGFCGNMVFIRSNGVSTGSSASQFSVNLPLELPIGSRGGLDIFVVKGSVTAAFAVNTATATVLDTGSATTGVTTAWKHLQFSNQTIPSGQIQIQISAPPGDFAEVYIDNVTALTPHQPRSPRYDYPGAFRAPQRWISDFCYPNQIPAVGDFDGDGLDDIVTFLRSAYPAQEGDVYVARNTGTGAFAFAGLWNGFFCIGSEIPAVGDFNGDGRDDIATFVPASGKVWVSLSSGTSFCVGREWYDTTAFGPFLYSGEVPLVADFNADGLADIATCTRGSFADVYVSLNTGRNFASATLWHSNFCPGAAIPKAGDCDGDGRADLVCFVRDTQTGTSLYDTVVVKSNGTSFVDSVPVHWHQNFAPNADYEPLLADLNGDGASDIVAVHSDGRVFAAISTGLDSFASGTGGTNTVDAAWQWMSGLRANGNEIPLTGHFDRDMNDDLCVFVRGERSGADFGGTFVALCGDLTPDRIDRVDAVRNIGPGNEIAVHGLLGPNLAARVRLIAPDGHTVIQPPLARSTATSAVFTVPPGCYPSGLYRLVIFEDTAFTLPDTRERSTTSWPVLLINSDDDWRRNHFSAWERTTPGISGDDADPDMDGYPNLAEFLFGTHPRVFSTPALNWSIVGDEHVASFTIRADRGCIRVALQQSPDLLTWSNRATATFDGTGSIGTTLHGFLPFSPSFSGHQRLFSRLQFTRP